MTPVEAAAAELERRIYADPSIAPLERYSGGLWRAILQRLPDYSPPWYRCLTMEYALGGAFFEFPLSNRPYLGMCTIPRPSRALELLYQGWPLPELFAFGYSAFAEGGNGNVWVFARDAEPDPRVLFLERTGWNGETPSLKNGLLDPEIRLSELLLHGATWIEEE